MSKETMTIHRALAELKLIDSKIEKAISVIEPTGMMQDGKLVNNFYQKEEFEKEAKAKFQSVIDLIERKNKIKSAIVTANGITQVTIANKRMTIADAINYKSAIIFNKDLITTLIKKHNTIKSKFIIENEKVNQIALNNAMVILGKEKDNKINPTDEDVKNIIVPFVKRNEFHLIDPLDVEKLTEKLQNEVDNFETEVDAVLSEINAMTIIEI